MNEKPVLLLVDDEERILRSLAMLFRGQYRVQATTDPQTALAFVARERVHVVVSDQRMPLMRGAELLRAIRERSPQTMRLLLTGYSELEAVVASVNEGEIFRYISKPWDAEELRTAVREAAEIAGSLFAAEPAAELPPVAGTRREQILVIDDDAEVVRSVRELLGADVPVHWAQSVEAALQRLGEEEFAVVVSELSVQQQSVLPLLKILKAQRPDIVTLVLTPFADVTVFVDLINQGQVYRLLPKPLRKGPLGMNLNSALRHHRLLRAMPTLQAAHRVQPLRTSDGEAQRIAGRVMGLLSRLRGRPAPSPAG